MRTDIDGMASLAKLVLDADQHEYWDGRPNLHRIAEMVRVNVDTVRKYGCKTSASGRIYAHKGDGCIEVYVKIGEIEVAAENAS